MTETLAAASPAETSPPDDLLPRISIVIPNFNHARFLRQCLDSALEQDYPRLQIIVRDGGSTDGSIDILRTYDDALQWTSGPDAGQAAAINAGLRDTEGEIIAWLNSDDYLLPGALLDAAACLTCPRRTMMTYSSAWMVDESGRRLRLYPTFNLRRDDLKRKCSICQPTVFLRREVFESVGPLCEDLELCFDYEWWLRIMATHEATFSPTIRAASRHYQSTKTAARRLRGLVEAGYVHRHHFGVITWRWSAKWVVRRWRLRPWRFLLPLWGWASALRSAIRYRNRFAAPGPASPWGRKILARMAGPGGNAD